MPQKISFIGLSKMESNLFKEILSKEAYKLRSISVSDDFDKTDLIIMGQEACDQMHEIKTKILNKHIPLLFYSTFDEDLIISCYKKGIDAFIDEQWSEVLIKAKIDAWLFFTKREKTYKVKLGNVSINFKKRKVTKKRKEIELTKIEYNILSLLAKDRTKVFSREEIYQQIWGDSIVVGERTLDVHMNNLRKKIGKSIIKTKKGIGFSINSNL